CALPHAPRKELEGTSPNFFAGTCHADDDRLTPTAVSALQSRTHDIHVARAVERIVRAADLIRPALRHVDEIGDKILTDFVGVDEMGHSKPLAPRLFLVI